MQTSDKMRELLQTLQPQSIEIIDDSALHAGHAGAREGGHYRLTIVSAQFEGRKTMERHRMVYAALASLMQSGIHALNISAKTPAES
ncbi:MAG: BolA family transcriptional regulator [Rhodocyclaceae bacterium]|jgi:BolA protein|nr:BolA family transcriptional regulator [Rhodocyclaceae bacterium]